MIQWPDGVAVREQEPMSAHTAWRTGGPAPWFLVVHRREALLQVLALFKAHKLGWSVLGAGTRTVVRDGGLRHVIVRLGVDFSRIEVLGTGVVSVGAGVPAPALAWWAAGRGLSGVEVLARAQGSVGGAFSQGLAADVIEQVTVPLRGRLQEVGPDRAQSAKLLCGVALRLRPEGSKKVLKRTRKNLKGRAALPSWYQKPKSGVAAAELRRVQMDGVRLRDALVPRSSPEMVVNLGSSTAQDLNLLHNSALERVAKLRGIKLESSARFVGRRHEK
ncbi:MAG: UDP-N-acetylmuramate dehydrogenase [Kiritimatiellia bacterium]|jgi:UDP-N-acetylmuramate dehydrogenase